MNHQEIKERIQLNLENANLAIQELRVQPAPFSGWRIAVVAAGFAGKSHEERKQIALQGLEAIEIEWLDLLTPEEREWAGVLPIDSTLEDLPLWPEALARSKNPESIEPSDIVFPSDLDEDLELPIVATFYSLRGGVGRSTALAYTARILASHNRTVLCVDMDLEAPGLAALFGKEGEIKAGQGLLSILLELDQGNRPDIAKHILRLADAEEIYGLPAGIPDANYARELNFIDPGAWYREERNPLRELMNMLGSELPFKPDVILLDARTGITPLNAPLLFDLADIAIVTFFPHPQTLTGTGALVRALLAARTRRDLPQKLTPEPRFLISPIPASKAPEVVERYQHRSLQWISDWLAVLERDKPEAAKIIPSEIAHFVPYRESIATSDRILNDRDVWQDFEPVAEWLERFLPAPSEQRFSVPMSDAKSQILAELEFSGGTAEHQANFLETFVDAGVINQALTPQIPLVLGRKGTGKTAIFRRLMEDEKQNSVVVLSPAPLTNNRLWVMNPDSFKAIEETLRDTGTSWREFWTVQTCLARHLSRPENRPQPDDAVAELLADEPDSELNVLRLVQRLLGVREIGLLARDWLTRIDQISQPPTLLLWDGLDTGFGNNQDDRNRRNAAIEGLFSLVTDMGDNLQALRFKIVLREDIWRRLRFENKSHFFGRSVTLNWANRADFFKVALKQALRSPKFQEISKPILGSFFLANDNYWMEEQVIQLWNLLVGERMRGGKSAFTRNWVWQRLADGSDNRSPRTLLQLFRAATEWEKREHPRNPYGKTAIRPRALIDSLEEVSQQAIDALVKEEFPELEGLIDQLKELGRSPFKTSELLNVDEELKLATEVGLIAVYEGTEDDVQRYKVPDLYRLGIGMTRKGQA